MRDLLSELFPKTARLMGGLGDDGGDPGERGEEMPRGQKGTAAARARETEESKRDRFMHLAVLRTRHVVGDLRVLSNCGNKSSYEYTEEDVNKIFAKIQEAVTQCRQAFMKQSAREREEFEL